MNLLVRILLGFVLAVLLSLDAKAHATLDCSRAVANNVTDTIYGRLYYHTVDNGYKEWDLLVQPGDHFVMWDFANEDLSDPANPIFPFSFVADSNDEFFQAVQYAGVTGDYCEIGIDAVVHHAPRSPIPQYVKDALGQMASDSSGKGDVAGFIARLAGDYNNLLGRGIGIFSLGYMLNADRLNTMAKDPFDPLYSIPYDPSFPYCDNPQYYFGVPYLDDDPFGDGTIQNSANSVLCLSGYLWGFADAILVSTDRANSCNQVGADCYDWQTNRVHIFLGYYADILSYMAGIINDAANYLDSKWNAQLDDGTYATNLLREGAYMLWNQSSGVRP